METLNVRIRIPTEHTEVKLVCMGCVHHGAAGCDEKEAQFWYAKVLRDPNTYLVLGGDLVDSINEKDPRYLEEEVARWCFDRKWGGTLIDRQYHYALEKWKPLAAAGKILWMHTGNHELALKRHASRDLTLDWSRALGVPYAGYEAFVNLTVDYYKRRNQGYSVSIYSTHGSGSAQADGAIINSAARMLDRFDCDAALMWHLHRRMHVGRCSLRLARTIRGLPPVVLPRDRLAAVCGSFLRSRMPGVTSYAEVKGHAPAILGPTVVHMRRQITGHTPGRHRTRYTRLWVSDAVRVA